VDLTAEAASAAIREGTPLLQAGRLAVDPDAVRAELARVARNLAETAELGSDAQRTAERIASAPPDVASLLAPALGGESELIDREADRSGVDRDAFARLLDLALQPFLWEAARVLGALTDIDAWDRGYCPVCAAWPVLAELVGPEKRRVLRCVRCGVAWSWLVLLCPYCGNDDHRTLRVLQEDSAAAAGARSGGPSSSQGGPSSSQGGTSGRSGERIDLCERCHGYVKAVPSYTPTSAVRLVAEDVATLDLDVAATSAGYRRPGDVDATTAGIPRLVREGRRSGVPSGSPDAS
jgi:FdhE protein